MTLALYQEEFIELNWESGCWQCDIAQAQLKCFPGQLNKEFMNIIANAIDALDESNMGRSFEEIKTNTNRIKISQHKEA